MLKYGMHNATTTFSAILTTEQTSEADRLTTQSGISANQLMANAGLAVAKAIEQRWSPRRVTVLCGPGNNGGDGFVVANLLAAEGWPVHVALLGERENLQGEARYHADQWQAVIGSVSLAALENAELVVDALFGAGLTRALQGEAAATLQAASQMGIPIVAIDVPSGLMGNTGEALGAVASTLTVTFFCKKPAHLLQPGRQLCGEVIVADIGIKADVLEQINPTLFENHPSLWQEQLPKLTESSHKYTRGHALIYGGYPLTGAARLAARGAARAGAGLTTIAVPEIAFPVYAAALTSIMVAPIAKAEDFERLLNDKRITAYLVGPGAGNDEAALQRTRQRTLSMLATGQAIVIDADAITAFSNHLPTLKSAIKGPCVMTPHEGEFSRLFDHLIIGKQDKLTRARLAAQESGAIVVLKGSDTVIAAPDGRAIINSNSPPTLATAGSGDVLSGVILGLLAQGMEPFMAAAAGVWLHGEAANEFGPGLIAEDLPEMLPSVLAKLL
ncbi:MAG: NAD(P)H-hydrate dehydratase [Methylophilaceae bacterium]|nr:NAD(P)H-hydrate dehydratase [Methylotenera sp.]